MIKEIAVQIGDGGDVFRRSINVRTRRMGAAADRYGEALQFIEKAMELGRFEGGGVREHPISQLQGVEMRGFVRSKDRIGARNEDTPRATSFVGRALAGPGILECVAVRICEANAEGF